jgi:hypothetical protein
MIGRLIRLIILVLVVLAAGRIGSAYLAHYKFDDQVSQIAQRAAALSTEVDVRTAVVDAARALDIPLDPEQVAIRFQGEHVYIDLHYTRPVEVFPRYVYPWRFSVSAHGWVLGSGRSGER